MQLYGFPAVDGPGGGVKVAFFRSGSPADPDSLDREIHPEEVQRMRAVLERCLPRERGTPGQAALHRAAARADRAAGLC